VTPPGPGRPLRNGLLLVGGVVGLLAPPVARRLHRRLRGGVRPDGDPVAPFCAAPCYGRRPETAAPPAAERTRAAP